MYLNKEERKVLAGHIVWLSAFIEANASCSNEAKVEVEIFKSILNKANKKAKQKGVKKL